MTNERIKNVLAAVAVNIIMIGAACLGGVLAYLAAVGVLAVIGHLYMIGGAR